MGRAGRPLKNDGITTEDRAAGRLKNSQITAVANYLRNRRRTGVAASLKNRELNHRPARSRWVRQSATSPTEVPGDHSPSTRKSSSSFVTSCVRMYSMIASSVTTPELATKKPLAHR